MTWLDSLPSTLNWVERLWELPDPFPSPLIMGKGRQRQTNWSLVPRPFYARGARWERGKGLVPVVRACVEFYGKIVFFGNFSILI